MESGPVCAWQASGQDAITFPVKRIEAGGGNRIPRRERVYRDGAKLDGTGAQPDQWTLTCAFFNGNKEQGVPGDTLYPDQLRALLKAVKSQDTGTLTLPTDGPKRCRADHWTRTDDDERRDYAILQITFVEDNEDDQTAASFSLPTARSAASAIAADVVANLEAEGVVSDDTVSLEQLCGELEELANAPEEFADDINSKVDEIVGTIQRIQLAFQDASAASEAAGTLLVPASTPANDGMRRLSDVASRSRVSAPRRTRIVRYPRVVSLIEVAASVGQEISDLMPLNSQYEDLGAIPRSAPIRVLAPS